MDELVSLRNEINALDDQIHDLIMRRVLIVEQVGRLKNPETSKRSFALRPAREQEIIKRLWDRHNGSLPKEVIVHLWRQLISACTNLQTPMSIAVHMPERGMGNLEIARDHFGSLTPTVACRFESLALKELMEGEVNIAVLSLNNDPKSCWWYSMAQEYKRSLAVFARLPLITDRYDGQTAFAIGKVSFEPTGDDRTLLVAETDGSLSLSTLDLMLKANDIPTNAICDTRSIDLTRKVHLFEVDGYMDFDDGRLDRMLEKEKDRIPLLRVIGGYPAPLFLK